MLVCIAVLIGTAVNVVELGYLLVEIDEGHRMPNIVEAKPGNPAVKGR